MTFSQRTAAMLGAADWLTTPLGAVERWPSSLRTAAEVIAHSDVPMLIWWGPQLVGIGNDASTSLFGARRPCATGRLANHAWSDHWPSFGEDVAGVWQRVPTVRTRMRLVRNVDDAREDVFLTHSLSPLENGDGSVGGLLHVCFDETPHVVERNRLDEQARKMLESITGSMVAVNADWRLTFANPAAELLLGETRGALLGCELWEKFPGLRGSDLESMYREAMRDRVVRSTRTFYPDHDRWYEVHVWPAAVPADGLSIYFQDITQRMRANEAWRDSAALLRGVSDATGDVIFAKDRAGRMRFANPAALALIGKPAERVLGRTDAEFLEDAEAARLLMENDRRVMESGVPIDVEEVVPLPDGTRRIWLSRKMPNRDAEGNVVGLLGVSRDMTEQKRAWERLRRLYDVVAALAEVTSVEDLGRVAVHEGIAALGATAGSLVLLADDGTTLEMVGMVGYPQATMEQWQKMPLDAAVPLAEAVRTGQPVYTRSAEQRLAEYPALRALSAESGTRSSACLPLRVGGRTVGALGLSFDSETAFSEEDRTFMLSLSGQCAQALDRVRLFAGEREAREEAERAGRMKDEFLATLSHELRTPLNAILGWASILVQAGPSSDDDLVRGLATIQRNARAQNKIIDDLLDMSSIINGKVRLEVQRCDLVRVLSAAVDTVKPTADAKGCGSSRSSPRTRAT